MGSEPEACRTTVDEGKKGQREGGEEVSRVGVPVASPFVASGGSGDEPSFEASPVVSYGSISDLSVIMSVGLTC